MKKHPTPDSIPSARALQPHELLEMFDRLVGYVVSRLCSVLRRKPTRDEVDDVVQEVSAAVLHGRNWPEGLDTWEYVAGVVWSVIATQRRSERRRRAMGQAVPVEAVEDELKGPSSGRIERIHAGETVDAVCELCADDAELSALVAAFIAGNEKPAELARALGCDVAHVNALVKRLRRRLDAAGLHPWSDDEDEERSRRDDRSPPGASPPGRRARRARAR